MSGPDLASVISAAETAIAMCRREHAVRGETPPDHALAEAVVHATMSLLREVAAREAGAA